MSRRQVIGLLFALASLAGCSHGTVTPAPIASTTTPTPPPAPTPTPAATATAGTLNQSVAFTIEIPAAPSPAPMERRRNGNPPPYLSPGTAAVSIALTAIDAVTLASPPAPSTVAVPANCTRPCTVHLTVPAGAGTDTYAVVTTAAGGAVISRGMVDVTVTAGTAAAQTLGGNSATLTVGGYVAAIALTITPNAFLPAHSSEAVVGVAALDASGATIIGATQFANPIVVSVSGTGYTLAGTGLSGNTLDMPESESQPLLLFYDGVGTSATLTATSTDGSGRPISATTTVTAASPTPAPTPTLPPVSTTQSLYVASGSDGTVSEFTQPSNAAPPSLRRTFSQPSLACPANFSSDVPVIAALAVDPSGNTFVGYPGSACPPGKGESIAEAAPNAIGTSPASIVAAAAPPASNQTAAQQFMSLQAPATNTLWFTDDTGYAMAQSISVTGGSLVSEHVLGAESPAIDACITSSGLPNSPVNGDPCRDPSGNAFASYTAPQLFVEQPTPGGVPLAVDSTGALILASVRIGDFVPGGVYPSGQIVEVPDQGSTSYPVARKAWIDSGDEQDLFQYASQAVESVATDGHTIFLLMAASSGLASPGSGPAYCALPNSTAACADGFPHFFILGFDASSLSSQSGAVTETPSLILGGDTIGRFGDSSVDPTAFTRLSLGNALAVSNGRLYVANPLGNNCDATCQATAPAHGEVDVYNATLRGVHVNDASSAPAFVLSGSDVRVPVAIAVGPQGTVLASNASRSARRIGRRSVSP